MDYDQILPTDFAPSTDEPPTAPLDERLDGIDAAAHAPDDEGDGEYKPEESAEQSKGKSATQGLSEEEKKARQKMQNRKAAERSRNKKREEQWVITRVACGDVLLKR